MPTPVLLEVCVESLASALAAEQGGAHRLELCSDLAVDGVTPPAPLMEEVRRRISIPIHVLIRPRPDDFSYSPAEFDQMKNDIRRAKEVGVNGVVFGILDSSRVDVEKTQALVELARPLSVTFHRAFDVCGNLEEALENVVQTSADRILTSGGARTAEQGSAVLAHLVKLAEGRVGILACGTIREANVRRIIEATGVREVHASFLERSSKARADAGALDGTEKQDSSLQPETVKRFLEAAELEML
jgi:copper homeostasis protein